MCGINILDQTIAKNPNVSRVLFYFSDLFVIILLFYLNTHFSVKIIFFLNDTIFITIAYTMYIVLLILCLKSLRNKIAVLFSL